MDKTEFIKIAIAAAIAACLKELVTLIIKHSPTVAAKLKAVLTPILKRHLPILPILFDVFFIGFGYWIIASALGDSAPATRGFTASCALIAIFVVQQFQSLPEHVREYRDNLLRTSPNHALQRTAPRVTVAANSSSGALTSGDPPQ